MRDVAAGGTDFRALFEAAPGLYLVLEPDFTIVAASHAYCRATLTTRDALLGRDLFEVFPDNPGDPSASGTRNLRASLDQVLRLRQPDAMAIQRYDIRRPEDEGGGFEERYWSPLNAPVLSADGRVGWIIHRVEDVTELVRLHSADAAQDAVELLQQRTLSHLRSANETLAHQIAADAELQGRLSAQGDQLRREMEERRASDLLYRHVVDLSFDGIWMHSGGRIVFANESALRLFGAKSSDELIGRSVLDLIHPEDRGRALWRTQSMMEQGRGAPVTEMKFLGEGGQIRLLEVQAVPFLYKGQPAILAAGRDIGERKQLEDQLRQAQKMEAIGQLTGGIAHDFNNLLGIVIGSLDGVLDQLHTGSPLGKAVSRALNGALHGAELTHRLLAFARRQPLDPKLFSINALIPDVAAILQRTLGDAISVQLALGEDLWPVFADPSQVQDALVNLAINARDAMPDGGLLTIETTNVRLDEHYASLNPDAKPGDYALLAVTDTGGGMAPDVARRALEPFFTTKPAGQGTGLGLSMIYGFTKQSGGHLKIYSELSHGTSVKLYLPRATAAAAPAPAPAEERRKPPGGTETILVAEDNEDLRQMVVEQLGNLGYRVIEAANGEAALATMRGEERIDLLFTDAIMSGQVTGHDLIREARSGRPDLHVLLTTGYAEKAATNGNGHTHFIRKPYRRRDLALKIRVILDRR